MIHLIYSNLLGIQSFYFFFSGDCESSLYGDGSGYGDTDGDGYGNAYVYGFNELDENPYLAFGITDGYFWDFGYSNGDGGSVLRFDIYLVKANE